VDVARAPVGLDEAVAAQDGQVLRQVRRFEPGLRLELRDGVLVAVREQLERSAPRTGASSTNGPRHGSERIRRGEDLTLDVSDEG